MVGCAGVMMWTGTGAETVETKLSFKSKMSLYLVELMNK